MNTLSPYDMSTSTPAHPPSSHMAHRLSRSTTSQSGWYPYRIEKPRSNHNSPRTVERRKTTTGVKLYATLDAEERKLWHSHVFEVKSGMLIMPQPSALMPTAAWEQAESAEMEDVVELYGKVYHLWQVDRGHKIPLGEPKLMTSFTKAEQMPDFETVVSERDSRFGGADWRRKKEIREYIKEPKIHPDADATWKQS